MTKHKTGTREEWLAARLELLQAEKELTRRSGSSRAVRPRISSFRSVGVVTRRPISWGRDASTHPDPS
jgi:hypothetical protein